MAKAAAPSPTGASPTPGSPKRPLAPAPAPFQGQGFFVGQSDGGNPRFKGDPGILWASQSVFTDGIGSHRHRYLLGVSWGGFCDCQVLPRSRVAGGGVPGGVGDSQRRPCSCGLIPKKRGCSLGTPLDALPLHRKKPPQDGLSSCGWPSPFRQKGRALRAPSLR